MQQVIEHTSGDCAARAADADIQQASSATAAIAALSFEVDMCEDAVIGIGSILSNRRREKQCCVYQAGQLTTGAVAKIRKMCHNGCRFNLSAAMGSI